jgi:4a-hydroxytetrahydrobiopterin dehydratase
MGSELAAKECAPCKGGVPPLSGKALRDLHRQLPGTWDVVGEHHLEKEFRFEGYMPGVEFTDMVAAIAEEQNHHPDILLTYGKVKVSIWTHKIDGLTESDFIFAAKVEEAFRARGD